MADFLSQLNSALSLGGSLRLGLDVGASSVKVVAVRARGDDIKVVGAAYEETPAGCVVDGVLGDPRTMVEVVKRALEKAKIKNYRGVPTSVGLRGVGVMFRRLMLPLQSGDEMSSQIILEAQQQIESDLSEWIVDYQVLTPPDRQGQVAVMLVGAKRPVAEDFMTLLRLTGVQPTVFDCDIFAMANAYEHSQGGRVSETVLCLDIGRDTTKFHLIQDNAPIIVRSFQTGGLHLTELIAKHLAVDYEQAESLKVAATHTEEGQMQREVETALAAYHRELCGEIKQTIEFFASSNSDTKVDVIDKVILSGGGATTRGLAKSIAELFNTKVEFMDPFLRADVTGKARATINEAPHIYAVAFGLAQRRVGDRES